MRCGPFERVVRPETIGIRFLTEALGAHERPGSRGLDHDGSSGPVEADLSPEVALVRQS